ncbi:MAG: MmcQ/YjbR family DNA-binding protein [Acidobacteriota bacterium]
MKYPWLDEYCLSKSFVEKDFKPEWNATRYMIKGKMFALQGGDKEGKAIFTVKLDPSHGLALRQQYTDIVPGYYMNKDHWNSLDLDGNVPGEVVKSMVDQSHRLIFESLNKKAQKELLDNEQ